jgi:NitT/TauT family transport system permease protein
VLGRPLHPRTTALITSVVVLAMVGAYFALSGWKHGINPADKTLPSLGQLATGFRELWRVRMGEGRWLLIDLSASATRFVLGMTLGSAVAFAIGLLTGCSRAGHAALLPPLAVLANVPATAMLAVYFIFVPTGQTMFVTMVALGILPSIAQGVHLAVREIKPERINTARMRGASPAEVVAHVIVPQVLPKFIDLVAHASGLALLILVASEMAIGGGEGIGYRIRLVMMKVEMAMILPYLVVLAGFGLAIQYALGAFQRWAFPWYLPGRK